MNDLNSLLLVFHVITAIIIVVLILLQKGKGADMGAAFGGGSSQSVFGSQGSASFLSRITASLAAIFFISALCLAYMYTQKGGAPRSVIETTTSQAPVAESVRERNSTDLPAVPGSKD